MIRYIARTLHHKVVETASNLGLVRRETFYRFKADRLGVRFLGSFERHRLALFQDPITGSSFAVREGETVEAGIRRVRTKFGLSA